MKRIVLTLAALLLILVGSLEGAPARLLYAPPPPVDVPPAAIDFRGTRWFGKTYENTDWTIIFEPNGGITNIENGHTYRVGSWKSTGPNTVWMELNNKYYEYRGTVTGDILSGDSSNVAGLRWKTTFRRMGS
jgi:hypothetical protein